MTLLQSSMDARDKLSTDATAALAKVKDLTRQSDQLTDAYRKYVIILCHMFYHMLISMC
jgi:hypothetical protein